ncbi:UNKNOWN [Stylonychia lemnae]|uniref:Uncharacterized protein n=1 Tax=Stylonychia lemnae TaxID=5949 RepID=A0A077ZRV0_STYLE|nr:UNKNOWN [Stylonychia lemnae]|eukprot:CDW72085.1 UNKNOWN [Stylonychia lemnae]
MLSFRVNRCNQNNLNSRGKKCASNSEIDKAVDNLEINLAFSSQYFDVENMSPNPIKNVIKNHFFTGSSLISQNYDYKISLNQAVLADNPVFKNVVERIRSFIDARYVRSFNRAILNGTQPYIGVFFALDENVQTISRDVYTLFDALAFAGGLFEILTISVHFFIASYQESMFYQSLIKDSFLVNQNSKGQCIQNAKIEAVNMYKKQYSLSQLSGNENKKIYYYKYIIQQLKD